MTKIQKPNTKPKSKLDKSELNAEIVRKLKKSKMGVMKIKNQFKEGNKSKVMLNLSKTTNKKRSKESIKSIKGDAIRNKLKSNKKSLVNQKISAQAHANKNKKIKAENNFIIEDNNEIIDGVNTNSENPKVIGKCNKNVDKDEKLISLRTAEEIEGSSEEIDQNIEEDDMRSPEKDKKKKESKNKKLKKKPAINLDQNIEEDGMRSLEINKKKKESKNKKLKKISAINLDQNIEEDDMGSPEEDKKTKESKNKKFKINVARFNETEFNKIVCEENIMNIVKALRKIVSEEMSTKKNQIFSDYKYLLNVICFRIPLCPKRLVKLKLTHSLVDENDDACLIVKDLERGRKIDYEPTIHYYEDLLNQAGIKGIKVIPFNQLKQEYRSYEMKIKLSNLYDYFMCDGSIVGHVFGFLGKHFQKARCTIHSVRMNTKNIAREIQKVLHKTSYKQGEKGALTSIPVATHKMTPKQITENILIVIKQLKTIYPGGLANIRQLQIKINIQGTSALPIYISLGAPPKIPYIIGPKGAKLRKLQRTTNELLSGFKLTQAGALVPKIVNINRTQKEQKDKQLKKKEKNISNEGKEDINGTDEDEKKTKILKTKNEKIETKEKVKSNLLRKTIQKKKKNNQMIFRKTKSARELHSLISKTK